MEPWKRTPSIALALPVSLVSDVPHLREKTSKVGLVARAAAAFRIDEIIIYRDRPYENQDREAELVVTLLRYIETPQYLRKLLFPADPLLQYAGILPPLRTPHHPLEKHSDHLRSREFREGVVVGKIGTRESIEIGVERPAVLPESLPEKTRVTVQVDAISKESIRVRRVDSSEIGIYWGFQVSDSKRTLSNAIRKGLFDLTVATSRSGKPLTEAIEEIRERCRSAQRILVAFGSPREGLDKILAKEGLAIDSMCDFNVNTVPLQGVETIRTEEAVWATLAIFNLMI